MRDYYADLGIKSDATSEEIRKAYIGLAKLYHPDTGEAKLDPTARTKFERVHNAYDILSDPQERRRYDKEFRRGRALDVVKGGLSLLDSFLDSPKVENRMSRIANNLSMRDESGVFGNPSGIYREETRQKGHRKTHQKRRTTKKRRKHGINKY